MKILVAEDDENSRVLQQTLLEAAGHEVIDVCNGTEALDAIQKTRPDLIISDIMMPEMDGYALCRTVKSDPQWADIPFVFYTATYTTEADQQLAIELGANLFLIKPLEPDAFVDEIRRILEWKSMPAKTSPLPPMNKNSIEIKYADALARKLDKKVLELRHTRSRLESSENRLQRIQESYRMAQKVAQMGSWDWDLTSGEFWWSDEIHALLGLSMESQTLDRALLLSRIAPTDRERFDLALNLAAKKGIPFHMDHDILGPGDEIRLAHSEAEIMARDPETAQPTRIVCVMRDITAQRRMEIDKTRIETSLRQAQKMEALGTLASGIAHDFNNVLTAILGNAELLRLQMPSISGDNQDSLEQIIVASRRASELVRQILTFSHQGEQAKAPIDLLSIIDEALKFIRAAIPSTIEIHTQLATDCPAILGESTQIYQVILNLCVNASHAMLPQGGRLDIELQSTQVDAYSDVARKGLRAGRYALLTVSDTGCGMDSTTQERIFEPYFTTKKTGEGTGLGLSVVHGIILAHNGFITVDSTPGHGTIFSIYLPAITRSVETVRQSPTELAYGQGEQILLVDDESLMTEVIANMLRELGYKVTEENHSAKALERLHKKPDFYRLLITDLTMPGMDGLELARAAKKLNPHLPIILCTGFSEVVAEPLVTESGIGLVLTKPFLFHEFARAIRSLLSKAASNP